MKVIIYTVTCAVHVHSASELSEQWDRYTAELKELIEVIVLKLIACCLI